MNIPFSTIVPTQDEIDAVVHALEDGWLSGTGKPVRDFESALKYLFGRKYAIATANGTLALESILRAIGLQAHEEVIVPAFTFIAPAAAVLNTGGRVVLADVTRENWTLDPAEVERLLTPRTVAVIAVDVIGHPCDYDALNTLCEQHNLLLIEDAAEAHGAAYHGRPCGTFGAASMFSFHANKAVATGEGGVILTDSDPLAAFFRAFGSHGVYAPAGVYRHDLVGSNHRFNSLSAAFGLTQVARWDALVAERNQIGAWYNARIGHRYPSRPISGWATAATWMHTVVVEEAAFSDGRDALLNKLKAGGIDARAVFPPLWTQPALQNARVRDRVRVGGRVNAQWIADHALMLPTFRGMTEVQVDYVCEVMLR